MEEEYEPVFDGEYESYLDHPKGQNDQILAGLCYIFGWIVCLISLLAIKPLSPYLRFHACQALGMHIIYMLMTFITVALMIVLIGFLLYPFVLGFYIYIVIVGIMILTGGDHRVPKLADYVEENYV